MWPYLMLMDPGSNVSSINSIVLVPESKYENWNGRKRFSRTSSRETEMEEIICKEKILGSTWGQKPGTTQHCNENLIIIKAVN